MNQEEYRRALADVRRHIDQRERATGRLTRRQLEDEPHLMEVRFARNDSRTVIKLTPVDGGAWRWEACYGTKGTFRLEHIVEAVQRARKAPQAPRWIAAMRVAATIRPAKTTTEYRIGPEEATHPLWCRVRRGLLGQRVEFISDLRRESQRVSIKYGKLKKVVRTLHTIEKDLVTK